MKSQFAIRPRRIVLLSGLALSLLAATKALAVTYTYEGLTTGVALAGQDNWTIVSGQPSANVGTGSGFNTTNVLQNPNTAGAHFNIRPNNLGFSFGSFTGAETEAVLGFDVQVNSTPGVRENVAFYVGDSVGNVSSSPQIQYGNTDSGIDPLFAVVKANGVGNTSAFLPLSEYSFGDWVRVRLTMDFTANGGDGFGSVSMANLTTGSPFTAVTGLQNLALGMSNVAVSEAAWNSMWTRTDVASNMTADNLTVAVPEPGMVCLLLLGGCLIGARRRRR